MAGRNRCAVGGRFRARWSYMRGSSKRRLPGILSNLGQIDIFIHDSLHSEQNVRFELDRAFAALRLGGAIVVDDIDANWGFRTFTQAFSGHQSMICEAEPLRPDLRRFNKKGLFGIILKEPIASASKISDFAIGPLRYAAKADDLESSRLWRGREITVGQGWTAANWNDGRHQIGEVWRLGIGIPGDFVGNLGSRPTAPVGTAGSPQPTVVSILLSRGT